MRWQHFVHDYFNFTRKERIGIIVIIGLIVFIWFLPDFISSAAKNKTPPADTSWIAKVRNLEVKNETPTESREYRDKNEDDYNYSFQKPASSYFTRPKGELFYFDPNTLPVEGWQKLGIRDKTIQTIQNYLSKGGRFKKPDDLQRIYGLHKEEYERLAPYIRIERSGEESEAEKTKTEESPEKKFTPRYTIIDINSADTTAFISLPGIGSKLAARIVNFRDKLGGFYSVEQVGETYGLPDSTFQKIRQYLKLENNSVKKININTATIDELKAHPYIRYSLANPIVAYRNEHGPFAGVADIKKVMAVTEEIFKKISPYLTTQ